MLIYIIGTGKVASALIQQLNLQQVPIELTMNTRAIDYRGKQYESSLENFMQILSENEGELKIVVDCTPSKELPLLYTKIMKFGNLVLANKEVFSQDIDIIPYIRSGRLLYEATCGAGLPIISTISDMVNSGDKILKVSGILSGTLSYIFNQLDDQNQTFMETLKKAEDLGYTEPDPRQDLTGEDVKNKLLVLMKTIGIIAPIKNKPLFPQELLTGNKSQFYQRAQEINQIIQSQRKGKMRFIAVADFENSKFKIGLKSITKDSPF